MSLSNYYDTIDEIVNTMADYLGLPEEDYDMSEPDEDEDYIDDVCCTRADVEMCGNILENYIGNLITISKAPDDEKIMKLAEQTVKKLNKLNEKCEYELIEAIQSDDICTFIHDAACEAGLVTDCENIADEWRDF